MDEKMTEKLREKLAKIEDKELFKKEIESIKSNDALADVRYELGYDPHPKKSTWKARYINRLLTRRNKRKDAFPLWVGIVVSSIISICSLIVAILALSKD